MATAYNLARRLNRTVMPTYTDKRRIIEHYDLLSPYYLKLWGEHIHHGYWATGVESKEEAQVALTDHLAEATRIRRCDTILDVGCGFGGSSLRLASKYQASVTGITISNTQAEIARQKADCANVTARFLVMDAEDITLGEKFDVVWSVEAVSHFADKAGFFARARELLKPGGTLALTDWFTGEGLTPSRRRDYITPIERGMLVDLKSMTDYVGMMHEAGLDVEATSDLSSRCARTWDITAELIKDRALWRLARAHAPELVRFLRSFNAMKKGFRSGSFVYGMIVARKS
jgi:tocopherol O-methyltransferase